MADRLVSTTHLDVNSQPRMPFSSPICEEVPSPVSPLDHPRNLQIFPRKILDTFSSPPLSANEPATGDIDSRETYDSSLGIDRDSPGSSSQVAKSVSWAVEAARAATRNAASRNTRNFSIYKPSRDKLRWNKKQELVRSKPGIRVVTSFSKPHGLEPVVQRPTDPQADSFRQPDSKIQVRRAFGYRTPVGTPMMLTEPQSMTGQDSVQRQGQQPGAFVSLSDLEAIDETTASMGFWKSVAGDSHKQKKKSKGKVEDTKRAEKRKQPPLSGFSSQKRNKNFRQNPRNFQVISNNEDQIPILAANDANAAIGPTKSIPAEQPDNGIIADLDAMDQPEKSLAPSPTKTEDGLSPSDRPIVIGLSIPSAKLAEFQFSPQSASPDSVNPTRTHNGHGRDPSESATVTPTILVTPASEGLDHMPLQTEQRTKGRPRARSSVYSQPGMSPASMADAIPPMPSVPTNAYKIRTSDNPFEAKANAVRDSTITVFEEDEEFKINGRGVSTYTVFEEDESPTELKGGRHRSGSGGIKPVKRSSTDTVGTRRPSLGWWNYLLTPFLTRSNTSATDGNQRSPSDEWERPVLPSLAQAATMASLQEEERDEKSWEKGFSPDTESSVRPRSGHTTMWSDMSAWEDEREAIGIAIDHTPRTSTIKPKTYHHSHKSSETIPVVMAGGSAGASAAGGFQETHEHNQKNPFRQVEEYKVGAKAHSKESNRFRPLVHLQDGLKARQLSHRETDLGGRAITDPFSDAHQQTTRQGHNPLLYDSPGSPNAVSRQEPALARLRSDSEATEFEEDDHIPAAHDTTNSSVRGAGAAIGIEGSKSGEGAVEMQKSEQQVMVESAQPPPYSPPRDGKFQPFIANPRTHPVAAYRQPDSPGPLSPGLTQLLSSRGAIPLSDVPLTPAPANVQRTGTIATDQSDLYMRPRAVPVTLADLERPSDARQNAEAKRQRLEREDALGRKLGGLWRGRACFNSKGCFGRGGAEGRKRRRWIFALTVGLILITILPIVLATTLHRKRPAKATPANSLQWLNLTGFPPIPTGVNTITQPDVFSVVTACIFPSTMWSCSLPKELQQSVYPNNPDQPNFNVQILYRNDSISNSSRPSSNKRTRDVAGNAASAGDIIRKNILMARDAILDGFWQPVPSPPGLEDQRFLGNTTDNVQSSIKDGEATPFYISFLPITSPSPKLSKRQRQSDSDTFPDLTANIPPPSSAADGTASPANLLPSPLPLQQPVRLYDRGLPTEHYGFYNYFDRSIFLKSTAMLNQSDVRLGAIPADENGGSTESEARVRCTWAQTRFLVQIWTNMGDQQLVKPEHGSSASSNFSGPSGSFPYPVTITVDRHGGDAAQKKVYCYSMDLRERIDPTQKQIALENRRFGGTLVGGGQGPLRDKITVAQGGLGGIDGGTGGCRCEWRNFRTQR